MKRKTNGPRIHYPRIPLDTRTMARMSMDIKEMPVSELGFKNILVCVCEFTNWIKAIPLADQKAQTIAVALYFKYVVSMVLQKQLFVMKLQPLHQ